MNSRTVSRERAVKRIKMIVITFGIMGLIHVVIPWTNIWFFNGMPNLAKGMICYGGAVGVLVSIVSYKETMNLVRHTS